ncbi:MAG: VWA domain-containing protein [Leptospirales bacterium]|nr:VWA domain-containing protein [Leptospirales bacterium]
MKRIVLIVFLLIAWNHVYASIAVLPYRDNAFDSRISGKEYAKMVSLQILLTKDIDVLSPEEAEIGMKQLGINPAGSVDADDLNAFGVKYNLSYILLGTISKKNKEFVFDNVLYSVKEKTILSRNNNSSSDIYKLVQIEIKDTLVNFGNTKTAVTREQADIVFILDSSYNITDEWADAKKAIYDFSSTLIGTHNIDTRIYLAPYSERNSYESITLHHNSIKDLNTTLSKLQPGGAAKLDKFQSLLDYTVKNIKWRNSAHKEIFIINNSKFEKSFSPERIAGEAIKKGIHINTICGGKINSEISDIERLATLTKGMNYSISYHQRVFDKSGKKYELYLQKGRIFHSITVFHEWKKGILYAGSSNPKYVKTPDILDEIYHSKISLTPDKLIQTFSEYTGVSVMQKEALQNNIGDILLSMAPTKSSDSFYYGRALITDGKISFWVKVKDKKIMDVLDNYGKNGFYLKIGFNIRKADSEAYGIELIPVRADVSKDYIPNLASTTFNDIVKNQDFFTTKGLGSPPVWFVDIKVENVELNNQKIDVRD